MTELAAGVPETLVYEPATPEEDPGALLSPHDSFNNPPQDPPEASPPSPSNLSTTPRKSPAPEIAVEEEPLNEPQEEEPQQEEIAQPEAIDQRSKTRVSGLPLPKVASSRTVREPRSMNKGLGNRSQTSLRSEGSNEGVIQAPRVVVERVEDVGRSEVKSGASNERSEPSSIPRPSRSSSKKSVARESDEISPESVPNLAEFIHAQAEAAEASVKASMAESAEHGRVAAGVWNHLFSQVLMDIESGAIRPLFSVPLVKASGAPLGLAASPKGSGRGKAPVSISKANRMNKADQARIAAKEKAAKIRAEAAAARESKRANEIRARQAEYARVTKLLSKSKALASADKHASSKPHHASAVPSKQLPANVDPKAYETRLRALETLAPAIGASETEKQAALAAEQARVRAIARRKEDKARREKMAAAQRARDEAIIREMEETERSLAAARAARAEAQAKAAEEARARRAAEREKRKAEIEASVRGAVKVNRSGPLYKRMAEEAEARLEAEKIAKRREAMEELRKRRAPVDFEALRVHERAEEERQLARSIALAKSREQKLRASITGDQASTPHTYRGRTRTRIEQEEVERRMALDRQRLERKALRMKQERYGDLVREVFVPKQDEVKKAEVEMRVAAAKDPVHAIRMKNAYIAAKSAEQRRARQTKNGTAWKPDDGHVAVRLPSPEEPSVEAVAAEEEVKMNAVAEVEKRRAEAVAEVERAERVAQVEHEAAELAKERAMIAAEKEALRQALEMLKQEEARVNEEKKKAERLRAEAAATAQASLYVTPSPRASLALREPSKGSVASEAEEVDLASEGEDGSEDESESESEGESEKDDGSDDGSDDESDDGSDDGSDDDFEELEDVEFPE